MALVRILYKTDHLHSISSRDLIGVFTSKQKFEDATRKIISKEIRKDPDVLTRDKESQIVWQTGFFFDKKQTQGLPEFELVFEVESTNKIF